MPRAIFNGTVVAESDEFEIVEGNVYFPPDSMKKGHFQPTPHTTICGWKGTANYFSVKADGETAENAAWTYHDPKPEAANIKDYVAFYPIVTVER
jgi:uncharacterized protein (DUF427 family)